VDRQRIVAELKMERDRLTDAIAALEGGGGSSTPSMGRRGRPRGTQTKGRRTHRLTPEGRRRLSEMMKRRWAERRRKSGKAA